VKKVAVFGNAGGGKSTVARKLAALTGLPLHVIDMMPDGEEFRKAHAELVQRDAWIIDGFGGAQAAWERFARADTLVYLDLPLFSHFLGVTRRMVKGLVAAPEGWPQGTPVIRTSLQSYGVLWPCHRHLTPKYRSSSPRRAAKRTFITCAPRPRSLHSSRASAGAHRRPESPIDRSPASGRATRARPRCGTARRRPLAWRAS
jgi:hypothetical protein